ncbi:dynein regulatory complex protein 11-like isoform X2 [Paralichthys olivaceus]|uniref:dynein regulatory complex protein 11-like isoform X2 n=1 Tax=Paralichthys olivaceus TaxID=8255 RepID=UPI00375218ED
MSQSAYNEKWGKVHLELSLLLAEELPAEPPHPEKDRVFQRVAMFYVRYLQIFRQLEEIYDQVVHPQKRRLIRSILDGVMGRLLELKNEMVEKEFSEYHYIIDIIRDLKLIPTALEIPIPRYFITECSKELQEQKAMVTDIFKMVEVNKSLETLMVEDMSQEEAIRIIQVAERARQGRLRAKLNQESRYIAWITKGPEAAKIDLAAICIQKVWRSYIQEKKAKIAWYEKMISIGLLRGPLEAKIKAIQAENRLTQQEREEDYQKAIVDVTKQLRVAESDFIASSLKAVIRQWFYECRALTGSFPDYPDVEDGGSAILFVQKTPQQLREEMAAKEEEDSNKTTKGKEEKKKNGKKEEKKGKTNIEEEEAGLKMLPSAFLSDLQVGNKTYDDFWKNRDESRNLDQRHEVELIKEDVRTVIEAEIRIQVDVELRQELAELKRTVDKHMGYKTTGKAKKKKEPKSGKKKTKEKDLTTDRTLESLCQELVEQGLLKKPNNVALQDYLADYLCIGTTLRQYDVEPLLSDVRQVLTLYGILPLGSQVIHEKAPLIKALLLTGPTGVGKKMLVHAICNETGANLFDLSPLNTAGKYPGKSGLAMMLHMVFKVARLLQPSVIWIGDAEKMFYKKVPKEEKELDPQRLKKDLPKFVQSIKGEDRVLIIGTTRDPSSADIKLLCNMYSKILLIPKPDYNSRYHLWKQLIIKQGGRFTEELDLCALTTISDGYTPGQMVQVVQSVLAKRRRIARGPLIAKDFIPAMAEFDPVRREEEDALKNWYAKTPLGKKRIQAATEKEEEEAPDKKAPGKNKDAKKKK